jgi:hypothetical protein
VRVAVFGDGVAEEKPVERGVVRGELRLQIVDYLLNDEGQFRGGEVAITRGLRAGLRLKFVQELAYLLDSLIHVGQNSTPREQDCRGFRGIFRGPRWVSGDEATKLLGMETNFKEPSLATVPELRDVLAELSAREPIFHRPELGTSRADFERMTVEDF